MTGDTVEHVGKVKEEKGTRGFVMCNVALHLSTGEIHKALEASFEGNAILATGEEKVSEGRAILLHDVLPGYTSDGRANGDGPELGRVGRVFVESHEVTGCNMWDNGGWNLIVNDQGQERGEPVKVGLGGGVRWLIESECTEGVREVTEGTGSGAFAEADEGTVKGFLADVELRRGVMASGMVMGLIAGGWRVQLLANFLGFFSHLGNWHSLGDAGICSVVV
ncbi:MAG: hypothetical protein ACRCZI_09875, partial [Cetobacterium sp.]